MLSDLQRAALEQALKARRRRTAERIAALTRDFDAIVASSAITPPDDEHDPDGATVAFERAQIAALLISARAQLDDLDAALDRLGGGVYGVCEGCAEPIAYERLLARPATRSCVACLDAGPVRSSP